MMAGDCLHIHADRPVPASDDGEHHRWGNKELLPFPQRVPTAAGSPNARDIYFCGNKPQTGTAVRAIGHLKRHRPGGANALALLATDLSLLTTEHQHRGSFSGGRSPGLTSDGRYSRSSELVAFLFRALTARTPSRKRFRQGKVGPSSTQERGGTRLSAAEAVQAGGGSVVERYLAAGLTAHGDARPALLCERAHGQDRDEQAEIGMSGCFQQEQGSVGRETVLGLPRARNTDRGDDWCCRLILVSIFRLRFALSGRSQGFLGRRKEGRASPHHQDEQQQTGHPDSPNGPTGGQEPVLPVRSSCCHDENRVLQRRLTLPWGRAPDAPPSLPSSLVSCNSYTGATALQSRLRKRCP
jgi:hypothetical protein